MTIASKPETPAAAAQRASHEVQRLLAIMAKLRNPDGGCPWDLEQSFETIAPYTIEEAYEVADAISRGHMGDLCDELGDLLFQAVFHAQMAAEQQIFDFADVAKAVSDKMERRHPHVFGDHTVNSADAQSVAWEDQKAAERDGKTPEGCAPASVLDDVPVALPALKRAQKLGKRMQRVGFDWPDTAAIANKVEEELEELRAELMTGDEQRIAEELGDLLFSVAQIGRRLGIDPEAALQAGNRKVEGRFRRLEQDVTDSGQTVSGLGMDALERAWLRVKAEEE